VRVKMIGVTIVSSEDNKNGGMDLELLVPEEHELSKPVTDGIKRAFGWAYGKSSACVDPPEV